MTSTLLLMIVLLLTVNVFALRRARRPVGKALGPLLDSYEMLQPVLIICGDCSGDSGTPRKTLLNVKGHCETCGGDNYVLASAFGVRFYQPPAAAEPRPDRRPQPVYLADYRAGTQAIKLAS